MKLKEFIYTRIVPRKIIRKWEDYKEGKLIFKCLPRTHFYDNGMFASIMDKNIYSSQYGQDYFLHNVIFPNLTDGFYLDIGANHPTSLNNTLFFENLGWKGLAFEPQTRLCERWKNTRKNACLNIALGREDREIGFIQSDDENGLYSRVKKNGDAGSDTYKIKQKRLQTVLDEYNICKVDFASIDVEGYEYEVLEGIDFSKTEIRCIVIENDKKNEMPDMKLRRYIEKKGYRFIGRIVIDDIFLKV